MASLKLVYLFTLLSSISFLTTKEQDDHGFWDSSWSGMQNTPNSAFQLNLRTLLSYLSSNATAKQFYNITVPSRNHSDTVYGMFVCWGDVPTQLCSQCVANATKAIFSDSYPNCSLSTYAVIGYGDCMIRFSNNHSLVSTADLSSPQSICNKDYVSNQTNFKSLFSKTINEAADEAANSPIGVKKYATKEARIAGFETLYCEAQCTPDLSPQDCRKCLNDTIDCAQQNCQGTLAGSCRKSICNIMYDVYPFYRPSTAPAPSELVPVTDLKYSQDPAYLSHNCSSNETTKSAFLSNLRTLLSSLSSNGATKTGFFKTTVDRVSGLFMCRGDLSPTLCQLCVSNATQRISSECPSTTEAIIWYNHCLLRYSDLSSLSTVDTTPTYHASISSILPNPASNKASSLGPWQILYLKWRSRRVTVPLRIMEEKQQN